jgi:putative flippase GtrA
VTTSEGSGNTPPRRVGVIRQAVSFLAAGLANTAVGYGAFAIALFIFGLSPLWSNVIAYATGLLVAVFLMRLWVFPSRKRKRQYVATFLAIFIVSYLVNLGVFSVGLTLTPLHPAVMQIIAMASYSVVFFVLGRFFLADKPGSKPTK